MAKLAIHPQQDWLLVQPYRPTTTEGGIALPDKNTLDGRKPTRGDVLKAGPQAPDVEGKVVVFDHFSPVELKIAGQDLLWVRAKDVIAMIEVEEQPLVEAATAGALDQLNGA